MKLVSTTRAKADLRDIVLSVTDFSPTAAMAFDRRLRSAAARLVDYPLSGRAGRVEEACGLVIAGTS